MSGVPNIQEIQRLIERFESLKKSHEGGEVWSGRDLQGLFEIASWKTFKNAVIRAQDHLEGSEADPAAHFIQEIDAIPGSRREQENFYMTRTGAYMLMQELQVKDTGLAAFAKTYFAGQTQAAEIIQKGMAELNDRLKSREELRKAERDLSATLWSRGVTAKGGIGIIRSEGDKALFGQPTRIVKKNVGGNSKKPLADNLHTINIKAKELTAAMTVHNAEEKDLQGHFQLENEHVENNLTIRDALGRRGIKPEDLPAGENTERLARQLASKRPRGKQAEGLQARTPRPTLPGPPAEPPGPEALGQTPLPFDE
ncbi:hypothetical protein [Geothrix paludis]|uniref:hypothetical protein n=1 Tax=Geothrix paludis TaxID=2922722 RepID=UPI001FAE242A|nr:hypothetical protein [Geothrix paludis]